MRGVGQECFQILVSLHLELLLRPNLINRPPYILNEAGGTNISKRSSGSSEAALSFSSTPATKTRKLQGTM